jgi:hypothetical protein
LPSTHETGLTQFLAEEVRQGAFADFLMQSAQAAQRGEPVAGASCNAHYVAFTPGEITIEHHYLEEWPVVRVTPERFIAALQTWRGALSP